MKKAIIAIGVLVLITGGLFFYDYKSMKSNVNLCIKIDEMNFKEAWNKECSKMGLGWDCNLPAQNPNREVFLKQVETNTKRCLEKHMKFRIFTFLNFLFEPEK
jgi:uncharacterized protein YxeA